MTQYDGVADLLMIQFEVWQQTIDDPIGGMGWGKPLGKKIITDQCFIEKNILTQHARKKTRQR